MPAGPDLADTAAVGVAEPGGRPPPGRRRRWPWVLLLIVIGSAGGYRFLGSETVKGWLVVATERGLSESWDGAIRLGAVTGNWWERFEVAGLQGRIAGGRYQLSTSALRARLELASLLGNKPAMTELEVDRIDIVGLPSAGWLAGVPPPPPSLMLADEGVRWRYRRARVGRLVLVPHAGQPLHCEIETLRLDPPGADGAQPLVCSFSATLYGVRLVAVTIDGRFDQERIGFLGRVAGRVLGATVATDLKLDAQTSLQIAGYLASTSFDLGALWAWWEPAVASMGVLPLVVDGTLTLAGPWLYQPGFGLSGNLRGSIDRLRMHLSRLLPMPFPPGFLTPDLLNADLDLTLTAAGLEVTDRGSRVFGLPVAVRGGYRQAESGGRRWDLGLEWRDKPVEQVWGQIPWLIRRQMGVPELEGSSTIVARLLGIEPPGLHVRFDLPDGRWPAAGLEHLRYHLDLQHAAASADGVTPLPPDPAWSAVPPTSASISGSVAVEAASQSGLPSDVGTSSRLAGSGDLGSEPGLVPPEFASGQPVAPPQAGAPLPPPGPRRWQGGLDFGWRAPRLPADLLAIRCGPQPLGALLAGPVAAEGRLELIDPGRIRLVVTLTGTRHQVLISADHDRGVWRQPAWAFTELGEAATGTFSLPQSGQGALDLGRIPWSAFLLPGR